ncbi:MAG: hypothetical protein NC223_01085 [Butyrivibrio sp.]|nr:hypothetical protein [Butyrivibrio sp.]
MGGSSFFGKMPRSAVFAVCSLAACVLAEIFIFNMNFMHLWGRDYKETVLPLAQAHTVNFDTDSGLSTGGKTVIEFDEVGIPVGTLSLDAALIGMDTLHISIDAADDTNAEYRYGIAELDIIKGNKKSCTIPLNLSGNVHKLRLSFSAEDNCAVGISEITLNKPIGLHFSPVRVLLIWAGIIFIYLMTASKLFKTPFEDNAACVKICAYALTAVLILTALMLTNSVRWATSGNTLADDFTQTSGNQITQEIVDAFEAGRADLLIDMNEELLKLDNPYDWSQRGGIGSYPWDHLLYNGKYYSYYGVAPVLALFLPYHKLTGFYFPSVWAIWLFGCIGIFFLTKTYLCIMRKFMGKTRSSLVLMGLLMTQLVSGIWFCFNLKNFYEIAQTCGFACVTAGAYFLISSNVVGEGKISAARLAAATAFLSLGVLSRPTLAVYCVAALIFVYAGFKKKKALYVGGSKAKYYIPYFLCALLPFVLFGGFQMYYNYVRFGSFFDFGIQYSLTINDFTRAEYHTHFVLIGFWNYLLALPSFSQDFPFIIPSSVDTFHPNGYYFVATASAIGLLWKALPLFSYGCGFKAYRQSACKEKRLYALMIAASCLLAPAVIIASIWESGYGARYCVDFAWQLLTGALLIAFTVYGRAGENTKKHLNNLMALSCVICGALTASQTIAWVLGGSMTSEGRQLLLSFGRLWEFWR